MEFLKCAAESLKMSNGVLYLEVLKSLFRFTELRESDFLTESSQSINLYM